MKTFIVTIKSDASPQDCENYLADAITCWGGSYPPDDPFFGLSAKDVEINYCGEKPSTP